MIHWNLSPLIGHALLCGDDTERVKLQLHAVISVKVTFNVSYDNNIFSDQGHAYKSGICLITVYFFLKYFVAKIIIMPLPKLKLASLLFVDC